MLEIGSIIILGIFAQWLAWRIKLPAILPLILIGLAVGPLSTLFSSEGLKLIEPMYDAGAGRGLFPGNTLFYFVSLSIGIILFEGGLTLKFSEVKEVAPSVLKLISVGMLITFAGAGLAAHFVNGLPWAMAFLFASLVIVTGPTVIAPILQNVPLNRNVATVLKWEGILIDPIGALAAVLMYEFIASAEGVEFTLHAFKQFITIVCVGTTVGLAAGYGLYYLLKREMVPHFLLNVFTLAMVLLVFVLSDELAHESGLLTVVVFGMTLANLDVPELKQILDFKESISVLLISILFILLAANMDLKQLELLLSWECLTLFCIIVFVLRPLGVFASTLKSEALNFQEKIFISWVGPRGIVAAGIASLFGIRLAAKGVPGAEYITPLVFMVVLGTVLLNATSAKPIAKLLGVTQKSSDGILIVGAHRFARFIGKYLQDNGRHVVLMDSNKSNVKDACAIGLESFEANVYTDDLSEHIELTDVGYMLALTGSSEVNNFVLRKYRDIFGERGAYRLITASELKLDRQALSAEEIFSYTDDFINLSDVARDFPEMHEIPVDNFEQLRFYLGKMSNTERHVAVFAKDPSGFIHILPLDISDLEVKEGWFLIYMGKELEATDKEYLPEAMEE